MSIFALADPILTASIYASGQIDSLLDDAVAPFWSLFREEFGAEPYLWCLRYELGGEHLKLRLHGPSELRGAMQSRLGEAVEPWLRQLRQQAQEAPPAAAPERIRGWLPPPIDAEDGVPQGDCRLVWTSCRRSAVSLGDKPFLADDRYAFLLTRCLGRGCDEVLAVAGPPPQAFAQRRQLTLWLLLVSGLGRCGERLAYLAYHRDWLIRLPLLKLQGFPEHGKEMLKRFEAICASRQSQLEFLAKWTGAAWSPEPSSAEPEESPFAAGVGELLSYLPSFAALPDACLDPFAAQPAFPVLFKVFHGLANQLGLSRNDEALACHMLLRSADREGALASAFELLPKRREAP